MPFGDLCLEGCCGEPVGFDRAAWTSVMSCYNRLQINVVPVPNIAGNIEKLQQVKLLFMGLDFSCGNAMAFTEEEWFWIKAWLEEGNRIVFCTEHQGNRISLQPNNPNLPGCLTDVDRCDEFLAYLGSSIHHARDQSDLGVCVGSGPDLNCGDFPLVRVTSWRIASMPQHWYPITGRASELFGGFPMFHMPHGSLPPPAEPPGTDHFGKVTFTADRIGGLGGGFIFVIGDSNWWSNRWDGISGIYIDRLTEWVKRWHTYANLEIV